MAHFHNSQRNIAQCIDNLKKAIDFGLKVKGLESINAKNADKIPIVDTYISACNACQL